MSKVFISWSGSRSKAVASLLNEWIGDVIQGVDCWYSPDHIEKGTAWFNEIANSLGEHSFGIVCLTEENLLEQWIHFEAGALFGGLQKSRVVPLLIGGLETTQVTGPLANFNMASVTKLDMRRLIGAINGHIAKPLSDQKLSTAFEVHWPAFEAAYANIPERSAGPVVPRRSADDMLSELLEGVRAIRRDMSIKYSTPASVTSMLADGARRKRPLIGAAVDSFGLPLTALAPGIRIHSASTITGDGGARGSVAFHLTEETSSVSAPIAFSSPIGGSPVIVLEMISVPDEMDRNSIVFSSEAYRSDGFSLRFKSVSEHVPLRCGAYRFNFDAYLE